MSEHPIVLLPGMDGTGELFRFVVPELRSRGFDPFVVRYPCDRVLPFDDYVAIALDAIRAAGVGPVTLLAESFSGPIGIRAAADLGEGIARLVLVASFARAPRPPVVRFASLLGELPFARPPGRLAIEASMTGRGAPRDVVLAVRESIARVRPAVMASRLRVLRDVDERASLARVSAPITYIRATRDRLVGRSSLAEIGGLRPDVRVAEVAAPHLSLQVAPGPCAATIEAPAARAEPYR